MKTKGFVLGGILGIILTFGYLDAYAATIRVPEDQPTIQQGIAAAKAGDTVLVNDGTYVEAINFLGKAIAVQSVHGASVTTINSSGGATVTFNSAETANSIIDGFTIRNGGSGGVRCENSSSPTIKNNIITRNSNGINCTNSSSPQIRQNVIYGNGSYGIITYSGSAPQIIENIISGHGESGIETHNAPAGTLIKNNVIIGNGNFSGIFCYDNSLPTIKNNIIAGNDYGIYAAGGSAPVIDYNNVWDNYSAGYVNCSAGPHGISVDPLFEEYTVTVLPGANPTIQQAIEAVPYRLGTASPCIGAGEGGVNIGAYPQQVSYGIPGEFLINVASGLYQETIVLPSYIQLIGEEAATTTIDANAAYGPVVKINGGKETVIRGFTIQNGSVGVKCGRSASPYIERNVITANGVGIETDSYSGPTVRDNIITANNNHGLYCHGPAGPGYGVLPIVYHNTITANGGNGIHIAPYNGPIISKNIISENGKDGIYKYDTGYPVIKNNLIYSNVANGINFAWHADGSVVNNDIVLNGANGIYLANDGWWCELKNNIIVANVAYGMRSDGVWSNVTSDYNDVWNNTGGNYGGYAGVGSHDISRDPMFVDQGTENFHLRRGSPCVDAGDPADDYSNEPEPNGDRINMGAYGNTPEATTSVIGRRPPRIPQEISQEPSLGSGF